MTYKSIISIVAVLFLIASASAAVYITYNPEARVYFTQDQPGPDVGSIQTLVQVPNTTGWTNSIDMNLYEMSDIPIALINDEPRDITGELIITMTCDEGIFMAADGTTRDFETIYYTAPDMITYECDNDTCITVINSETVEFASGDVRTIPAERKTYANLKVELVPMAYGNYTCTIEVREV